VECGSRPSLVMWLAKKRFGLLTSLQMSLPLGPVHTCLYVRVRKTGDFDLFLLEWVTVETDGLTEGCFSEGFPGFARM